MIIIGIDPGIRKTGYGIIKSSKNNAELVDYGIISSNSDESVAKRIYSIYCDVEMLISKYKPVVLSIEDIFFSNNVKSMLLLGQARGAALIAAASKEMIIYEYSAKKIKQSLTGNGNSGKHQVQFMVQNILKLSSPPSPLDASDALAAALCHFQQIEVTSL